jgi:CRISPR-associated endoribonuclease Cas6
LIQNLISKAKAFASSVGDDADIDEVLPDFSFRPVGKIHKNGVKIKQLTPHQSMLIGYMYEFEFNAPTALHEIGYYAGFGHLGSQGFGCVGVK